MRTSAVAGLIFANSDDKLKKLTANRSMASVPFGCRYRLISLAPLLNRVDNVLEHIHIVILFIVVKLVYVDIEYLFVISKTCKKTVQIVDTCIVDNICFGV